MNVPMEQQVVIPMPSVLTLMVVMSVLATLALEETDMSATVSTVFFKGVSRGLLMIIS